MIFSSHEEWATKIIIESHGDTWNVTILQKVLPTMISPTILPIPPPPELSQFVHFCQQKQLS